MNVLCLFLILITSCNMDAYNNIHMIWPSTPLNLLWAAWPAGKGKEHNCVYSLLFAEIHKIQSLLTDLPPQPLTLLSQISSFLLTSLRNPGLLLLTKQSTKDLKHLNFLSFLQQLLKQRVLFAICSSWLEKSIIQISVTASPV